MKPDFRYLTHHIEPLQTGAIAMKKESGNKIATSLQRLTDSLLTYVRNIFRKAPLPQASKRALRKR
jgi:hypothetical protein